MDYFFTTIFPIIMIVPLVVMIIFAVINHLNKEKLIKHVLSSEEKRQSYIRMNKMLLSTYKKIFWQVIAVFPILAIALYFFLPDLFHRLAVLFIEAVLFFVLTTDDYFYRKSFLKAIENKLEGETP